MSVVLDEFGYFRLLELVRLSFPPFGLPIERDIHFKPGMLRELDLNPKGELQ